MALRILGSTLNLSPRAAATWTAKQHREYLEATGYNGTTYYPLNNVLAAQIAAGVQVGDFIAAMQQPWRERTRLQVVRSLIGTVVDQPHQAKAAGFEAAMNLAMPPLDRGLAVLARVQRRMGTEALRPIIVHPQGQMMGDALGDLARKPNTRPNYRTEGARRILGELQWQPTVEFAYHRGVLSKNPATLVDAMVELAQDDGLGRAAFDANHAQAVRQGRWFADPVGMAARFAQTGQLGSFEFSLQPHLGGNIDDLRMVMDGNIEDTIHGQMLAAAAANTAPGDDFDVRVEIPDYAWSELGYTDHIGPQRDLVTMLGAFTGSYLRPMP